MNQMPANPSHANVFQAGSTCPSCQESITEGQLVQICPQCGSIHHEPCWSRKPGCSSYHCDDTVRVNAANYQADIVINSQELDRLPQQPALKAKRPLPIAAKKPRTKRTNRGVLSYMSLVLVACAAVGIVGALLKSSALLALGIALALGSIVTGVISLVQQGQKNGALAAAGPLSILASSVLIIVYFIAVSLTVRQGDLPLKTYFKNIDALPTEQRLERMNPQRARSLRANVIITCQKGLAGHSLGSGIVLKAQDSLAYILTNRHVIDTGKEANIDVMFYTGEQSKAALLWLAPDNIDLAILSCPALTLEKNQPIPLANYTVGEGEKVFAVGNPMGFSWSYTEGIISSLRSQALKNVSTRLEIYQTQAPINTGNSGGGLYTMDGSLIGVITWTQDKGVAEGLNFATATTSILPLLTEEQKQEYLGAIHSQQDQEAGAIDASIGNNSEDSNSTNTADANSGGVHSY